MGYEVRIEWDSDEEGWVILDYETGEKTYKVKWVFSCLEALEYARDQGKSVMLIDGKGEKEVM